MDIVGHPLKISCSFIKGVPMSRVIFLDVDGPMIPIRAVHLPNQTALLSIFDPCAVAMLNKLIQLSNAKIVISSIRGQDGFDSCVAMLQRNGIDPTHLHSDWVTPRDRFARHHQIADWLILHPEITHYVAIDDEDLDVSIVPFAVKCDAIEGFSYRNYIESCVALEAYYDDFDRKSHYIEQIQLLKHREILRTCRNTENNVETVRQAAHTLYDIGASHPRSNHDE